jgi:hypothetical protein
MRVRAKKKRQKKQIVFLLTVFGSLLFLFEQGKDLLFVCSVSRMTIDMSYTSSLQLMSKVRDQYSINDRLREYIERMLTVIIEHNPQLLEVTTSTGLSIGSMTMSSAETRKKSTSSDVLVSNESTRANAPSMSMTAKQSADKYCRL